MIPQSSALTITPWGYPTHNDLDKKITIITHNCSDIILVNDHTETSLVSFFCSLFKEF